MTTEWDTLLVCPQFFMSNRDSCSTPPMMEPCVEPRSIVAEFHHETRNRCMKRVINGEITYRTYSNRNLLVVIS